MLVSTMTGECGLPSLRCALPHKAKSATSFFSVSLRVSFNVANQEGSGKFLAQLMHAIHIRLQETLRCEALGLAENQNGLLFQIEDSPALVPKREVNLEWFVLVDFVMKVRGVGDVRMITVQIARKRVKRKNRGVSTLGVIGHAEGTHDAVMPRRAFEVQTALGKEIVLEASFAFNLVTQRVDAVPILLAAVGALKHKAETQDVGFDEAVEANPSCN
jgi:hypothetical protein